MPGFGVATRERWERCRRLWPEVLFVGGLYGVLLMLFGLLRGVLLWRNALSASRIAPFQLARSFLIGARFDLAVISYLLIPLLLLLLLFPRRRHLWLAGFHLLVGLCLLLGLAEAEFYRMFASRFNAQVFSGLRCPLALCREVWQTCPVAGCLLLWGGMLAILLIGSGWLQRRLLRPWPSARNREMPCCTSWGRWWPWR